MKTAVVDLDPIVDWNSFHDLFASRFGFPDYYGRNMNAWIDCMEDFAIGEDFLVLDLQGMRGLKGRCHEVYDAINECAAFINFRAIESGGQAVVAVCYGND